jgi:predicted kinase
MTVLDLIPAPALVILIGPAGSGKSTLARAWPADHVLELDAYRALVSGDPGDQDATDDAVTALHTVLRARLSRRLTSVIDATNTDAPVRRRLVDAAHEHDVPAIGIVMLTSLELCQRRNALRPPNRRVPVNEVNRQAQQLNGFTHKLSDEGFDQVLTSDDLDEQLVRTVLAKELREATDTIHTGLFQLERLLAGQDDIEVIAAARALTAYLADPIAPAVEK